MSLDKKARQLVKLTDKQERELLKQLQKQYSIALKDTRALVSEVYAKYNLGGEMTYAEISKFNRLTKLEKELVSELNKLYANTGKEIRSTLGKVYTDSYLYTGFSLESEAQVKLAYSMVSREQVNRALQNNISGLTLNDRLKNNRAQIIIKTREQLTQGLIQGESISQMANRLKNVYEGDLNKAVRIARTETNRVRNEGTLDSYEHAKNRGLEFDKIWLSTIDGRVRDSHAQLDGQKADKDGLFHVNGLSTIGPGQFSIASEDIHCRCTTRVEFKDLEATERRVRGEGVIPYTDYQSWYKNRVS
jgi:SPP1 gp7 family putative phage head morphogenesis protein